MGFTPHVHVPCAVIERASASDMTYAACPRCATSLAAALQHLPLDRIGVSCPSCGAAVPRDGVAFKYRLKMQLLFDDVVRDAMLFNESAEALLGVSASRFRQLLKQHPTLPALLEDLLLGLRVSFTYLPAQNRQQSSMFQKDLKVLSMQPLARVLLPKPPVELALLQLTRSDAM